MSATAPTLELTIGPGSAALEAARLRLVEHLRQRLPAAGPRTVFAVELVLEEWVSNAFAHGAASRMRLAAVPTARGVELQFEDDGRPFDPTLHPERVPPASLDDAQPGGLGLGLLRRYATSLRYERRDGLNRLMVEVAAG